ncbi:uncharacterized protein LOC105179484 [Sesamum indicum]|uniref:Uncharacterized protein LOC105179484 n=1 Tax=Sesamum indicum TaxID=4182 RepID=A0A6I9UI83_SESIN|nr:uncharacterized protein LOC105179484 [Sesamum indicum]
MGCKMQRRMALRRKFRILRTLTKSKSVKKSSIVMDASLYLYKLRLQVEAVQKHYHYLINHIQEVKVDKVAGTEYIVVKVRCKKSEELLVSILGAFEEMNVNVVEAKLSNCSHLFRMEAILHAHHHDIDATILHQAVLRLIQSQTHHT